MDAECRSLVAEQQRLVERMGEALLIADAAERTDVGRALREVARLKALCTDMIRRRREADMREARR